jgi:hypothetical protein
MRQINYRIRDAISDTYTQKFLEKIPSFPAEVLTIQLVIPPTARRFIEFDYQGAEIILENLFAQTQLNYGKENFGVFLIEFEQHEFYSELSMELRVVITGDISQKTLSKIKKNTLDQTFKEMDISASLIEFSDVKVTQLENLVRPYIPEIGGHYDKDKIKIMNRLYFLPLADNDKKVTNKDKGKIIKNSLGNG